MTKSDLCKTMMPSRNWVFPGLFIVVVSLMILFGGAPVSYAQTLLDPLHGVCDAPTPACTDNGTVTPTTSTTPYYGFTISPGPATGVYEVVTLIPNNISGANSESFSVNGAVTSPAPATLFSSTAWTSGFLASYLGIASSPSNPLSAFLTTTDSHDPGATGYFVYVSVLGTNTLLPPVPQRQRLSYMMAASPSRLGRQSLVS